MDIPPSYHGREQAFVKHSVLERYLAELFMILGRHEPVLCYVDCFAGPWLSGDEKLSDTSIARSIKQVESAQSSLEEVFKRKVKFRALYIEKNDRAFKLLNDFLKSNNSPVEAFCLKGDFLDLRDQILEWCKKDFTFFFIDPMGYKEIGIPQLEPLLRRDNSEFLINFMYQFINMALAEKHKDTLHPYMLDIFGYVPEVDGLDPIEREWHLISLYKERAKELIPRYGARGPWSASIRIMDPTVARTKYHLVYFTRHALGIDKFMGQLEHAEKMRPLIKADIERRALDASGQGVLDFGMTDEEVLNSQKQTYDHYLIAEAKKLWLDRLPDTEPVAFTIEDMADMVEESNLVPSLLQAALGELIKGKIVKNLDDLGGRRRKRFIHFEKRERLVKIS